LAVYAGWIEKFDAAGFYVVQRRNDFDTAFIDGTSNYVAATQDLPRCAKSVARRDVIHKRLERTTDDIRQIESPQIIYTSAN